MQKNKNIQQEIQLLTKQFLHSADFTAKEITVLPGEQAIICYYSSLVNKSEVEKSLYLLKIERKRARIEAQKNATNQKENQSESNSSSSASQQQPESNQQKTNIHPSNQKESNHNTSDNQQAKQNETDQDKSNNPQTKQNESDQNNLQDQQTKQNESEQNKSNDQQMNQTRSNQNMSSNQVSEQTNSSQQNNASEQDQLSEEEMRQTASISITTEPYDQQKVIEYVCSGETLLILLDTQELVRLENPEFVHNGPEEPGNEQILRGSHEGFVEHFDSNVALVRKRIKNNQLVVKKVMLDKKTKTQAYYFYVDDIVDKEALKTVEERLQSIEIDMFYSVGQLSDQLDDSVWSPFPQLINTERPDRVVANILEGKIAIMTDISPTALIGPVTFFSFYQSPDDFNSRVLIGTFYRVLRMVSLLAAIFFPSFYIAIVSFHFEVIPLELANKVKMDINKIPYRPFIEAVIMQLTIELIREASVRLPKSIGQTIGIVGGLVIGQSIVNAGLVSNIMVIVVAFTAISSFVVPSVELNTSIRILAFPFMILASLFGFFGIMIGTFILVVHLLNLSSLKQPYFAPIVPFDPNGIKQIFFRKPHYRAHKQVTSFSPQKDDNV